LYGKHFKSDFKLDILPSKQERVTWLSKEEPDPSQVPLLLKLNPHLRESELKRIIERPYGQPITQVCEDDLVEISLNWFNFIPTDHLTWEEP
jgi:hypothetical protein